MSPCLRNGDFDGVFTLLPDCRRCVVGRECITWIYPFRVGFALSVRFTRRGRVRSYFGKFHFLVVSEKTNEKFFVRLFLLSIGTILTYYRPFYFDNGKAR